MGLSETQGRGPALKVAILEQSERVPHSLLRIRTQINAILRVIERDERGKLDVKTFLDRFQVP